MDHKQGFGHTGPRNMKPEDLKWQVRINLSEDFAKVARKDPADASLKPLLDVLAKYDGRLKHQEMSFGNFLPHFENEERPLHEKRLADLQQALRDAGAAGDVEAGIKAMKEFEAASAEFVERTRLYLWTMETMQKPETAAKYATRFTIYAGGNEIYDKDIADGLVRDLEALKPSGMVRRIDKFDSDPAHNPQPPARFHK